MKKELKWGETPWDNMTREQLLREVQRMYHVVDCAYSAVRMEKEMDPRSAYNPYWQEGGSGWRLLERCKVVIEPILKIYDSENLYRMFFRYAVDLLFSHRLGFNWFICPVCLVWVGPGHDKPDINGTRCGDYLHTDCPGILRRPTWDDLKPEKQGE